MGDVLAQIVQSGGSHEVFAVFKGRPLKKPDGSERVNIICTRATGAEAQQLADQFEVAQRHVMFLEFLSARMVKHGGSAELATVDNATVYAAFLEEFGFNKPGQPRLYTVHCIRVAKKLENGDDIPAAPPAPEPPK